MASQQLHSYLGRAGLWRNVSNKLAEKGTRLAPCDAKALKDLCAGVTWMQRVPPAVLASYRALYVILRGDAADAEEEINRDILRTVRSIPGLLLDFSQDQRGDFAGSINRVLNALAHVDDMGYCQGQNYVVDVMMKAGLPERETFCLFLYLLRQGHLHGIYRKEVPMLAGYMDKFEEQLRLRLPKLAAHFEAEHYPPPLYALEWITTLFGLAAQPLISLVALDLFLAGARNPVLRMCVSLLGGMEDELLTLDQEGLLKEFRSRAVAADAEEVIVRALSDGGGRAADVKRSRAGADRHLGWSTGPDYLLVLRSRHCQTMGLVELREEAKNGLLVQNSELQDALLAVTRSIGWGCLRSCWMKSCLVAGSDHERYLLANESLRFVITNGGHSKAAAFLLGVGGADANGVDSRLLSPLHLVALFNRPDVARVLLMCGASPKLVGGVTRAAAARGGKLWSPLEMAEEACTEGGELDDAGVAVGPAALFVLRGLVCLQCNVKLPKPKPCGTCNLTFCSTCLGKHYCVGRLNLPRGVAEGAGGAGVGAKPAGSGGSKDSTASSASGSPLGSTRWELGSAIGDNWEALFSEKNANARGGTARAEGEEEWKPGGLRRAESGMSKTTEEDIDFGAPPGPWTTMASVLLGTWERRPLTSSPCDRDKLFDNSAAFVRACFPAQTWLQHHMEEEMGLSLRKARPGGDWGGPIKGLGMHGEYFNPVIMRAAASTELHRRMSWVMAESGVPWEDSDQTWCCPECFILFSLNVFRHHCRGCGQVYCSAHAPPTEVPPGDRSLKLCWSCVLEGAAPLPSPLLEDVTTMISLSPTTARGLADGLSPTVVASDADACSAGAVYVPPQPPSPLRKHQEDDDDERQRKKDGGFLSALVSLIEVVAAPTTPVRSRGAAGAGRSGEASKSVTPTATAGVATAGVARGGAGRDQLERASRPTRGRDGGGGGDPSLSSLGPTGEARAASGFPPRSPVRSTQGGGAVLPRRRAQRQPRPPRSPTSSDALSREMQSGVAAGDSAGGDWRGGWSSPPAGHSVTHRERAFESPPKLKLERGFGSSLSTASSTEPGDDYEAHLRRRGGGGSGPTNGVVERGGASREKPVELGFPSERPWAHGFGSG